MVIAVRTRKSGVSLGLIPACKYEFSRIHGGVMLCGFKADPIIGAYYDDSLSREVGTYDWGYFVALFLEEFKETEFHDVK